LLKAVSHNIELEIAYSAYLLHYRGPAYLKQTQGFSQSSWKAMVIFDSGLSSFWG